jgi:hypothetical protein
MTVKAKIGKVLRVATDRTRSLHAAASAIGATFFKGG